MLIGPSPHHCSPIGRAPIHSSVKQYLVLSLGKEIAVQAVVGSIVWAFRKLEKAKVSGDERPRLRFIAYALNYRCAGVQAVVGSIVWAFRRFKKAEESGDERPG